MNMPAKIDKAPPGFLRMDEFCARVPCSRTSVYALLTRGVVQAEKRFGKVYLAEAEIEKARDAFVIDWAPRGARRIKRRRDETSAAP